MRVLLYNKETLLRILQDAAKIYSIGKRIQGEDEENLITLNKKKQLQESTELLDQIATGRQTFYAWDKPLVT
jgi:hypothetical protein